MMLPCPLKFLTGYDCPFCGGQRALAAIAHGDISDAFWFNPVLFCLTPYILTVVACSLSQRLRTSAFGAWCYDTRTIMGALTIFALWGIIRNIIGI